MRSHRIYGTFHLTVLRYGWCPCAHHITAKASWSIPHVFVIIVVIVCPAFPLPLGVSFSSPSLSNYGVHDGLVQHLIQVIYLLCRQTQQFETRPPNSCFTLFPFVPVQLDCCAPALGCTKPLFVSASFTNAGTSVANCSMYMAKWQDRTDTL